MKINADFAQRVVVHGKEMAWKDSPIAGVGRKMLDRIGDEVARATTLVRYDPGSWFSAHVHSGGEEFIVVEGVFEDEHGIYPAGSYIRNPPLTQHTPGSVKGCTIFVKLWQFDPDDRNPVRLNINSMKAKPVFERPGVSVIPLYQDTHEEVRVEVWQPGAKVNITATWGTELFVLEGSFEESGDHLQSQSWLRAPIDSKIVATAGSFGTRVWIKTGHLRFVNAPNN